MSKPLSSEEIKSYWNDFKDTYIEKFEETTTAIFNSLLPICKISSASKIIEAGCGAGNGLQVLRNNLPETTEIFANDLSEAMLSVAQSKQLQNVTLVLANNEILPYPDAFADRYISNLSLQLVENPQNMLKEAFRVLQPGGIAVFSVWGKPKNNNWFFIIGKCCKESGISSETRSNFHLGDSQGLRKIVEDAGFIKVLCFESCVGFGIYDADQATEFACNLPMMEEIKSSSQENYEKLIGLIRDEIQKELNLGNAIVFDCLVAVGVKN